MDFQRIDYKQIFDMSKGNIALLEAVKRGYSVTDSGCAKNPNGINLKGNLSCGYLKISVRVGKNCWGVPIHRLQAYQKYGEAIFEKGVHVRHLNGLAHDNSVGNISIGSSSDNHMDKPVEVRIRCATTASRSYQNKIRSLENRLSIYYDLQKGLSFSKIMKKHFVSSKGTLSFMKNKSIEYQQFINSQQII